MFLFKQLFAVLFFVFFSELQADCCRANGTSLHCLLKANESDNCDLEGTFEHQHELNVIFNHVPHQLHVKLLTGALANITVEEITKLPTNLLYFLPINKLETLSGTHLSSLLILHKDDLPLAKKILQSVSTDLQRMEFLNSLSQKVITNNKVLDFIGETVYKWNYDVLDGKFQKLSNICGYALARLWTPYVLTRTSSIRIRLLNLLNEVIQKSKYSISCDKDTQIYWKNLPKSARKLWSFLAINQSFPSPLNEWTVKQIAQYKLWLPDFSNDELQQIPFDEQSKMELHDIDFDYPQARFLFSWLIENSTLKDVKILYPSFFLKLSPLQINQFTPEEWANEKAVISSIKNTILSYAAAKQIFNKIASDWLSSKTNFVNGWTSKDLKHLPLFHTQPATSFLKFCVTPPSVQSLIAIDSYLLTDRQAFYLSGCSSMLSFNNSNDNSNVLGLKYMLSAVPVSSLLNIDSATINYEITSHLVSLVKNNNLPMALHLLNIINPAKQNYFIEEMLKNEYNILFDQFVPLDIPGPVFDALKQLYSNYTDRIDKLPKHILSSVLENQELLGKWTSNKSAISKGLYNGYTCKFIKKLNSVEFIISISNYNAFLKQNGKAFPKNLQTCVAEAFINYLKTKLKLTADLSMTLYLEAWEIEAVQGFVLVTLPTNVILNSTLRDTIIYAIGQLSFPELMIASQPNKLSILVDQYITSFVLKNGSNISYEHLYILGNLIHYIPTSYLNLIDEHALKFLIDTGLFDTRMCVDSISKNKWADLLIKAYGNIEKWSSDTLITLSDLLIVLNPDQLNCIPAMSRVNSADIIQTHYADEIEWLSHNIPFYKGCELLLDDNVNFINSLSNLVDFHLASIQNQVQLISPINDHRQNKEIIKSSEAKQKITKPHILISVPTFDNDFSKLPLNIYFSGKEKQNLPLSTKEKFELTSTTDKSNGELEFYPKVENITESPSILDINSSTASSYLSQTNMSRYNQTLNSSEVESFAENAFEVTFVPFNNDSNFNKISNVSKINHTNGIKHYNQPLIIEDNINKFENNEHHLTPLLDIKNRKWLYDIKNDVDSIISNNSFLSDIIQVPSFGDITLNQTENSRKKRSFELFFNPNVQIGCDALKILGPASIKSMKFDSIVNTLSSEELEECVDLLGSFDIKFELAKYVFSKIKDKKALHTYGSVLSGLSIDDIKTIDLDIKSPWSLELISLLSKHVKIDSIRKEIVKLFLTKSKLGMPSHLWGSFGSLICQLQPRTFKIIMPNKELFWKTSSAFNSIKVCDTPCIKNLASIAVSVIGQSDLWKTVEVERMGVIISGINITQWQLLLNVNSESLEGLSPVAVKCLDEPHIKLLNASHLKYLTPKSAHTLLEVHSKLLDTQSKETLVNLVNFEIEVDWQMPTAVIPVEGHKHITDNNSKTASIYAFEDTNSIAFNEMQADSHATIKHVIPFSLMCAMGLLFILK